MKKISYDIISVYISLRKASYLWVVLLFVGCVEFSPVFPGSTWTQHWSQIGLCGGFQSSLQPRVHTVVQLVRQHRQTETDGDTDLLPMMWQYTFRDFFLKFNLKIKQPRRLKKNKQTLTHFCVWHFSVVWRSHGADNEVDAKTSCRLDERWGLCLCCHTL